MRLLLAFQVLLHDSSKHCLSKASNDLDINLDQRLRNSLIQEQAGETLACPCLITSILDLQVWHQAFRVFLGSFASPANSDQLLLITVHRSNRKRPSHESKHLIITRMPWRVNVPFFVRNIFNCNNFTGNGLSPLSWGVLCRTLF